VAGPDPHRRRTLVFVAVTLGVLCILMVTNYQSAPPAIGVDSARQMLAADSSVVVLDVRTPEEYRGHTGHLPGARLIPLPELGRRLEELRPFGDRTIVVYCRHGQRSLNAVALLRRHGFNALNLEGGILKWMEARNPVNVKEQ
jgi:rhodanese-related sulfurtransferase